MNRNNLKILYVAPRYHTNQIPLIRGWLKNGHRVCFVSHFTRPGEDYRELTPIVLGYSKIFIIFMRIYSKIFIKRKNKEQKEYQLSLKLGFPPFGKVHAQMCSFRPDLVIVRERVLYNVPFYKICKKNNIPCILYNQSPLWDKPNRDDSFVKRGLLYFLPKKRITPVLGIVGEEKEKTKNSYYVPFVMEPHFSWENKVHFEKNLIHLICVGRYESRKQMFLLLDAVKDLIKKFSIQLTFVGEVISIEQKDYYKRLENKICEYGLQKNITLLQNLKRDQVFEEYRKADLFVLPSTKERASVSQLEAMSCSLPIICSDTNGSACYVEKGVNGYLFRDSDLADLKDKLYKIISKKDYLVEMGKNSYDLVNEKYQFTNYYNSIMNIAYSEE
jgi:glycosyltransferase involved in cell wall biosynthesis